MLLAILLEQDLMNQLLTPASSEGDLGVRDYSVHAGFIPKPPQLELVLE